MTLRLKIISPLKATAADLERRQRRYHQQAQPETAVSVLNLDSGPQALNSSGDILSSAAAIFAIGSKITRDDCEAILIDCVFDPAVDELYEETGILTFGPTRTTLPLISLVAPNFSIIARSQRQCDLLAKLVQREGFGNRIQSVRALDISYEEAKQTEIYHKVMLSKLETAVSKDGAEAIMFGSTTMALTDDMRRKAGGKPLFMPGMIALSVIEQLWFGGLWPVYSGNSSS
jgi:Asp/Glu/hydantoin racemase